MAFSQLHDRSIPTFRHWRARSVPISASNRTRFPVRWRYIVVDSFSRSNPPDKTSGPAGEPLSAITTVWVPSPRQDNLLVACKLIVALDQRCEADCIDKTRRPRIRPISIALQGKMHSFGGSRRPTDQDRDRSATRTALASMPLHSEQMPSPMMLDLSSSCFYADT